MSVPGAAGASAVARSAEEADKASTAVPVEYKAPKPRKKWAEFIAVLAFVLVCTAGMFGSRWGLSGSHF